MNIDRNHLGIQKTAAEESSLFPSVFQKLPGKLEKDMEERTWLMS